MSDELKEATTDVARDTHLAFAFGPVRIAGVWYAIVGEGDDAHVRRYGTWHEPPTPDEGATPVWERSAARVFRMAWQAELARNR